MIFQNKGVKKNYLWKKNIIYQMFTFLVVFVYFVYIHLMQINCVICNIFQQK